MLAKRSPEVRESWVCRGNPRKFNTASRSSAGGRSGEAEAGEAAGPACVGGGS